MRHCLMNIYIYSQLYIIIDICIKYTCNPVTCYNFTYLYTQLILYSKYLVKWCSYIDVIEVGATAHPLNSLKGPLLIITDQLLQLHSISMTSTVVSYTKFPFYSTLFPCYFHTTSNFHILPSYFHSISNIHFISIPTSILFQYLHI